MKSDAVKRASARTEKAAPPPPAMKGIAGEAMLDIAASQERTTVNMANVERARACGQLSTAIAMVAEASLLIAQVLAEGPR